MIVVADDGLGLTAGASGTAGTGLGIRHVRERLAVAYGAAAAVDLSDNPAGGVTVTLRIPS